MSSAAASYILPPTTTTLPSLKLINPDLAPAGSQSEHDHPRSVGVTASRRHKLLSQARCPEITPKVAYKVQFSHVPCFERTHPL